ncbi:DUF1345 domain-containing protein [Herbiconiux sp.]|uniref:DUF1345 domain-containing protein n=1 Tax=Herbiconiux sp. TaxID=1871186 RepID=UPI0025C12CA7|nr:DUF1345 domain-containing protein [Herbiconiux sp.]
MTHASIPPERGGPRRWPLVLAFVLSVTAQLMMLLFGVAFILSEQTEASIFALVSWCLLGTVYGTVTVVVLTLVSRRRRSAALPPSRMEMSLPARIVSFAGTFFATVIGLVAAFQVLTERSDPTYGVLVAVIGVWAMLLAWGSLHWGFAQIYQQQYYSATASEAPPMRFPSTPQPGVIEFVYFSFTLGTSFAASDVEVQSTRLRWRVTVHSVLSFFFNGLIVVLALNTILSVGSA